jgi:hypothetical protein
MSYEGFEQVLCSNGHYYIFDCYDFWEAENWHCPTCGAKATWSNMVDTTNGSYETDEEGRILYNKEGKEIRIDGYVEMHILDKCKCDHCGSILARRYKTPTYADLAEAKPWRYKKEA